MMIAWGIHARILGFPSPSYEELIEAQAEREIRPACAFQLTER